VNTSHTRKDDSHERTRGTSSPDSGTQVAHAQLFPGIEPEAPPSGLENVEDNETIKPQERRSTYGLVDQVSRPNHELFDDNYF
jgi:hypothetical protein